MLLVDHQVEIGRDHVTTVQTLMTAQSELLCSLIDTVSHTGISSLVCYIISSQAIETEAKDGNK